VANPGNDHRLGANEAPPAIVSIFLGDQLTDIFDQLASGPAKSSKKGGILKLGVSTLPPLPRDTTDRNRTSPFAFTGNKFEFRMVGSSQSTAGPMFTLNTIVADVLMELADEMEKAKDAKVATMKILHRIANDHNRIIFNGDNYCEDWVKEAAKRGLPNIRSTVESIETILDKDNVAVFQRHSVLSSTELHARVEVLFENYAKSILIEAKTMISMARRQIMPAAVKYAEQLASSLMALKNAGGESSALAGMVDKIANLIQSLDEATAALEKAIAKTISTGGAEKKARTCHDLVVEAMKQLRIVGDTLETIIDAGLWPLPTYAEMLFLK
jgi:glutamine synthetase